MIKSLLLLSLCGLVGCAGFPSKLNCDLETKKIAHAWSFMGVSFETSLPAAADKLCTDAMASVVSQPTTIKRK